MHLILFEATLAGSEKPVCKKQQTWLDGSWFLAGGCYVGSRYPLEDGKAINSVLSMSKGVVWVELQKHHQGQELTAFIIRRREQSWGS